MSILKSMDLLLPNDNIDKSKWAVIACDQFTSEEKYWESVQNLIGNNPSSYFVTLPEVYLKDDNGEKIQAINETMINYLNSNVLKNIGKCFVLVDRTTKFAEHRLGLVCCIDLEEYSFVPNDKAKIRATERTVVERIPPRLEIRKGAAFEMSHIMLLVDDRKTKVIENLYSKRDSFEKLYDFDLNMEGGHITGYKIVDTIAVINDFMTLLDDEYIKETFGIEDKILFAVGDGNHSLATAKANWDSVKENLTVEQRESHPARYAMVEVNNIHDEGLTFHPIHRMVYNADEKFVNGILNLYKEPNCSRTTMIYKGVKMLLNLPKNTPQAVKLVQDYIDQYLENNPNSSVDYIHGTQNVMDICRNRQNSVGIIMPKMDKNDLFPYILKNGLLTRKAFSIGEAVEKRYYLEAKMIK